MTLEDVARVAGVAPATVSRAMNNPEKVAGKTLKRINAAIAATGYVPNLLAGGLASNRSHLIVAIIPSILNPVYAETIQSFIERLDGTGYQVLIGESGFGLDEEDRLVTTILSRRPDAIFLTGITHTRECRRKLLAAGIPVVETWDITPTPLDLVVGFSHESVGRAAANYLYDRGHRQFGIVAADDPRAQNRNGAFCAELARLGVERVESAVIPGVASLAHGRIGFRDLANRGFRKGAVFCSSDTIAHGVIAEAQARKLRIPGDIAILGFGDQSFAAYTNPALSSVRIDRAAMGELAAHAVLARLNDEPVSNPMVDIGFSIIERDSA
ncbi:MAG: LacI family DNA-binding transcriptional regulator [Tropicimonas sp.]